MFIIYRENFLPFFDRISNHFVQLLSPNRNWADHQWGICVFDDVIEFSGPACAKYQGFFLQPLAVYVKDKSCEVSEYNCFRTFQFLTELVFVLVERFCTTKLYML